MTNEYRATMVKLRVSPVLILFAICGVNLVEPLVKESLSKFLGSLAGVKQVRIPELLNQLCNESQGSDTVRRDACYGCFFRASSQTVGYPLLVTMSNCAYIYLNNTDYGHCQQYLSNATGTANSRTNPTTIYCTFLECVRQVNKDNLEARIKLRTSPSFKMISRRVPLFYLKLYKKLSKAVCVIREQNSDSNTVRPGAEPIDPRQQKIKSQKFIISEKSNCT
ncbi:uncharacterized protein LOC117235195 isoform X1 [Bombus vosnesenskii]|uniref:Uncharacterized protein LOC117235195 isoform X1 n=1 Tax=Bombus vosnesenskii TaxID=207650 RepID=A0A6J3KID5_9HYME|nr:uncharacterized protein LOC117235195 isoform X1 [Bombus vosnesenskii]